MKHESMNGMSKRGFLHERCLLAVFLGASLLSVAAPVHSAEHSKAQQLIAEALELRRAGQDTEALPKLEEAYALAPTPRAAAQWGLCLQAVGRWSEADTRLAEALKVKTDPWIAKNRDTLKESLEQVKQNVARIEVNGGPDGAMVAINGRNVGAYPLPGALAVNAGSVDIEVTKSGFKPGARTITIAGGQYQRLVIRLDAADSSLATGSLSRDVVSKAPDEALAASPALSPGAERPVYKRPWVWAAVGAVVAGAALAYAISAGGGGATAPVPDGEGVFNQ